MLQHAIPQFWRSFNIFRADFGRLYPEKQCELFIAYCSTFYDAPLWNYPEIQCELFIAYCSTFYHAPLWNICSATFKQLCAVWRKCLRKIWRVHYMTHCDVIALISHCKPMDIGIQQRFCKFVANTFQNGTPVLRTIVLTAQNNPLSRIKAFVRGIHRWPVNSTHKWPVTRKIFPFDDVMMRYLITVGWLAVSIGPIWHAPHFPLHWNMVKWYKTIHFPNCSNMLR